MNAPKIVTREIADDIIAMAKIGKTRAEIGKKYNYSNGFVSKIIKDPDYFVNRKFGDRLKKEKRDIYKINGVEIKNKKLAFAVINAMTLYESWPGYERLTTDVNKHEDINVQHTSVKAILTNLKKAGVVLKSRKGAYSQASWTLAEKKKVDATTYQKEILFSLFGNTPSGLKGLKCTDCGIYFVEENGHPVVCESCGKRRDYMRKFPLPISKFKEIGD